MTNWKLKYLKYKLKFEKLEQNAGMLIGLENDSKILPIIDSISKYVVEYKVLFNITSSLNDLRTFVHVRLNTPYKTFLGTEKEWHTFYISSGTGEGSVKGRLQPFFGNISSYSQI